jgi:hypothetical protein
VGSTRGDTASARGARAIAVARRSGSRPASTFAGLATKIPIGAELNGDWGIGGSLSHQIRNRAARAAAIGRLADAGPRNSTMTSGFDRPGRFDCPSPTMSGRNHTKARRNEVSSRRRGIGHIRIGQRTRQCQIRVRSAPDSPLSFGQIQSESCHRRLIRECSNGVTRNDNSSAAKPFLTRRRVYVEYN